MKVQEMFHDLIKIQEMLQNHLKVQDMLNDWCATTYKGVEDVSEDDKGPGGPSSKLQDLIKIKENEVRTTRTQETEKGKPGEQEEWGSQGRLPLERVLTPKYVMNVRWVRLSFGHNLNKTIDFIHVFFLFFFCLFRKDF